MLHSSDEPGELSQRQCHDDSTVNIVVTIATTITSLLAITLLRQLGGILFGTGLKEIISFWCNKVKGGTSRKNGILSPVVVPGLLSVAPSHNV